MEVGTWRDVALSGYIIVEGGEAEFKPNLIITGHITQGHHHPDPDTKRSMIGDSASVETRNQEVTMVKS